MGARRLKETRSSQAVLHWKHFGNVTLASIRYTELGGEVVIPRRSTEILQRFFSTKEKKPCGQSERLQ